MRPSFRKITFLLTTPTLLDVEWYFAYQAKGVDVLYKKIVIYGKILIYDNSRPIFVKDLILFIPPLLAVKL